MIRKGNSQRWPGLDPSKKPIVDSNWRPDDKPIDKSDWELNKAFTRWQDFYPLLIASETSLNHIRKTLVKSVWPLTPPESEEEDEVGGEQPGVYGDEIGGKVHSYQVPKKLNKEEWGGE